MFFLEKEGKVTDTSHNVRKIWWKAIRRGDLEKVRYDPDDQVKVGDEIDRNNYTWVIRRDHRRFSDLNVMSLAKAEAYSRKVEPYSPPDVEGLGDTLRRRIEAFCAKEDIESFEQLKSHKGEAIESIKGLGETLFDRIDTKEFFDV